MITKIETASINGIRLVNIYNDSNISFIGIATNTGSNFETPDVAGIAHFAEHLFFKGTNTKNWHQLNERFAMLGIAQNAYTDNNEVLYHCTVPHQNVLSAWNLMMDMFFNSTFDNEELQKERQVIIEERKMYDDYPLYAFYDHLGAEMFAWDKGHSILGEMETINNIDRYKIIQYLNDKCNIANITFIHCGKTLTKDLVRHLRRQIPKDHAYLREGDFNKCSTRLWHDGWQGDCLANRYKSKRKCGKAIFRYDRKEISQAHIFLPLEALHPNHKYWTAQKVLMSYLGGGMFSILFSRIREELGLCYSVACERRSINYPHNILFSISGGTAPKNVGKFINECEKELFKIKKDGLCKKTFECAKTDMIAHTLRRTQTSQDLTLFLMDNIASGQAIVTPEEMIFSIERVKMKDCLSVAEQVFCHPFRWAVMMPVG